MIAARLLCAVACMRETELTEHTTLNAAFESLTKSLTLSTWGRISFLPSVATESEGSALCHRTLLMTAHYKISGEEQCGCRGCNASVLCIIYHACFCLTVSTSFGAQRSIPNLRLHCVALRQPYLHASNMCEGHTKSLLLTYAQPATFYLFRRCLL